MVLTPRQHNAAADPASKNAKIHEGTSRGAHHRQSFTIRPLAPIYTPLTIAGERLDMSVPGLFILAGGEPRVQ